MPHPVDIHLGRRLRHRRWVLGKTQGELADALGVRFQQVQKYESGTNRISASRLWDIAKALEVPIDHFFLGLEGCGAEVEHEELQSDRVPEARNGPQPTESAVAHPVNLGIAFVCP
ncbi:helix-turn-helix domain-containing protein [Litoreibacter janthinus]|uniref:Transcriptional regulator, contains XRE-family HTH domain n=1 Tax=Litoreibacter janthinus TaxID=670154 RepID=A0A1I6GLP9_9RHOB|nr:helix-turn-helix transcriptional regulator [Litoreibacter janthinus]SFR43133.1 Transcriptional regulator, contains XRE-family HTH domain [Litoreibacter janthinus]